MNQRIFIDVHASYVAVVKGLIKYILMEKISVVQFSKYFILISFYLGKVHQRYVRNPAEDPLLVMEGTLPNYSDDQYVPAPAKIGIRLLLIKQK